MSFLYYSVAIAQTDYEKLKDYIPYEYSSYSTHPIITIKVKVHVIQKSASTPKNITKENLDYIDKQFVWINQMYSKFSKPTILPESKDTFYIPDSRIRFRLDTVLFHVDEQDWDRIRTVVHMSGGAPWEVDSVDIEKNEILIKGRVAGRFGNAVDSIAVAYADGNNAVYTLLSKRQDRHVTYLKMKENLSKEIIGGRLTYYKKEDLNCSQDIWRKYANSDKNYLHIFYTGSSREDNSFGCGPSPYFLNVSNIEKSQGYAVALLSGHELGHCLGLNHTNRPQFSDLPKTDKFGWIDCNNTNTSNNIMGYNKCRRYLSPLQVAYIHSRYSTDTNLIKLTTANEYDEGNNVVIRKNLTWKKAMLIRGDIIVKKGKKLEIEAPVSMAKGSVIYIEKKAELVINGATITNHFGDQWGGIVICKSYSRKNKKLKDPFKKGKVKIINGAILENTILIK